MSTLDKVILWRNPDGTVRATYFIREAIKNDETEDQFIERQVDYLRKSHSDFTDLRTFPSTKEDITDQLQKPKGHWERLRMDPDGTLKIDETIKTKEEVRLEKKQGAIDKLKAIGLSDDEINAMLR